MAIDDPKLPYIVPPVDVVKLAEAGQVPLLMPSDSYRVAAIAKIDSLPGRYLYVARGVSAKVIGHLQRTEQNAEEYNRLRKSQERLEDRARLDLFHDLDHVAAGRHLGRHVVCGPVRRAHPPPDCRRAGSFARQSR